MSNLAFGVGVLGAGKSIPEKKLSNQELEIRWGVPEGTIESKTGVRTRYVVQPHEKNSELSARAALMALEKAGVSPNEVGLIITCTFTGDYVYPAVSCKIQELIGAKNAGAFDVMANCTGFQVGLTLGADRLRIDPSLNYVLVIGSALQSRFIDWNKKESALYFGDGFGAAVLGKVPVGYGMLASDIFTESRAFDSVRMRGGGSSHPITPENVREGLQYYELDGLEVWKQVVQFQPKSIRRALDKANVAAHDIDMFIFHQANLKLIEFLMAKMKLSMNKTFTTVEKYGNTADASQAITLCEALEEGRIKRDDLVAISGVGAGFTFGTSILRWY